MGVNGVRVNGKWGQPPFTLEYDILLVMPRITRTDVGGEIYHVLNRANARAQIFDNDNDYTLNYETPLIL